MGCWHIGWCVRGSASGRIWCASTSTTGSAPQSSTTFEPPTRRIVDPPKSVNVNIALAIGRSGGGGFRDTTPLKVRAEGLAMDSIVEGTLYAWARTGTGDWLACSYSS